MNLDAVRVAIQQGNILTTAHALSEAVAEGIPVADVWASFLVPDADVIEDYAADPRGPSCLILTYVGGRPIHSVVAYPAKRHAAQRQLIAVAILVTVYRPDMRPHEWSADYRTRRQFP